MGQTELLKMILLELLIEMKSDLKRRSYDEEGEKKQETVERVEALHQLIVQIKEKRKKKENPPHGVFDLGNFEQIKG